MLRELHKLHEIHFAALDDPRNLEGPARSSEYSSRHIREEHSAPPRRSLRFIPQLLKSIFDPIPLAVSRYSSANLRRKIDALIASEHYDSIVCDFLPSAPNFRDLSKCVLFQHNVEATFVVRHIDKSRSWLHNAFYSMQARKMEEYERRACQQARHVVAVSETDAATMRHKYQLNNVSSVSTGVDIDYFAPRPTALTKTDIVFCASMDALTNIDAVEYFLDAVFPLIRERIPSATFAIVGRSPDDRVIKAAKAWSGVTVTGTVEDVRPFLWSAKISVVPMRIGSGTRIKIYEYMASGVPVVSTTMGAEGLDYMDGVDIEIADNPLDFAAKCVRLLTDERARQDFASRALHRTRTNRSWETTAREFEAILEKNRLSGS